MYASDFNAGPYVKFRMLGRVIKANCGLRFRFICSELRRGMHQATLSTLGVEVQYISYMGCMKSLTGQMPGLTALCFQAGPVRPHILRLGYWLQCSSDYPEARM